MSKRIDQRIVEMSFENHKFEKGIRQSKESLKKFTDVLKNTGTGKEFTGLENSVSSISSSFSMMEQIGVGALRRIGEAAVNAGGSLMKSLTIDQLSAGLSKYQEKIEAVQTMVSAGYDFDRVEKSMEQLMWFSDETSYSFSDMAGNMAKFIAAGVDLQTSERAMQGIATWAAHSGKNSQAASIAMFNLSQAISMGYVDTLNWRSIMNQNMNTVMFKQIAIGVAEATGAIKKGQVTIQNFDSNLKDKWFTNDVLLKTLDQYSQYAVKVREVQEEMNFDTAKQAMDYMDAHADQYSDVLNQIGNAAFKASQESKSFMDSINATMDAVSSGWLKTYEIIFGTLFEAKENFSTLTEILWTIFAASAEGRNEMLQAIKDAGGIKTTFQIIKNMATALLKPLRAISQAFDQFFPPKTESQWMGIINILETITRRLIITEETSKKIQRTFAGFFAVLDIGWETVKFLGSALYQIVDIFIPLNGNLLEMTATAGDFLVVLNHLIKQSGVFQYGLLGVRVAATLIKNTLSNVINIIREFITMLWTTDKPLEFLGQTVKNIFSGVISTIQSGITWISSKFLGGLSNVQKFLDTKFNVDSEGILGGIVNILKDFIGYLSKEGNESLSSFADILTNLDFSKIVTFTTGGILLLFINQLSNLTGSMSKLINTTNTFITRFSRKLFGTQTKIKDLAYVFGILSASLFVLSRIPWEDMKKGLTGLAGAIGLFVAAYGSIQAITVLSTKALKGMEVVKATFSLTALAGGLAVMAVAIKQISKIDENDIWRSVGVLTAMMGILVAYQSLTALVSIIPGMKLVNTKFRGIASGLSALIGAILVLNFITPEMITSGINKISSLLATLALIQTLFALSARLSGGNRLSTSLLGIAGGILALIGVIKILNAVNIRDLADGVKNVFLLGGVLGAIQIVFSLAARVSGGLRLKTNIFSMQVGLYSMVGLLAIMNQIDSTKIQNGIKNLTKMAGIIAGLEILTALAARIAGGNKVQRILGSVTLTMVAFTALITVLSIFKQDTIDKGLGTIAKMLTIILAFQTLLSATSRISGTATSIGTILGMVTGLLAITASLVLLGIQDQTVLMNAARSLSITLAALGLMSSGFALLIRSTSGLSRGIQGLKAIVSHLIPGFAAMGTIVIAAVALIEIIRRSNVDQVSWDGFAKFAVGITALTGVVAAFTILSKVPGLSIGASGILGLVPGLTGMGGVVLATGALFKVMGSVLSTVEQLSWDSFGKFIAGIGLISILAIGLTLLSVPLAAVGAAFLPVIGGTLVVVAGAGLVIGAFVGLATIMEQLFNKNPDLLINGIDKLVLVGEGLGRFFGAIAGGFQSERMIQYGEGLSGFADAISRIKPEAFDGVESLAKALLILTGTSIADGFSRIVNFGRNPGAVFGDQLKGLIKSFDGITTDDATRTSNILVALRPVADNLSYIIDAAQTIPNSGGLVGIFAGNNDIDDFGKQLRKFIKSFNKTEVSDATHTSNVLIALKPMMDSFKEFVSVSGDIPNSGGILGYWIGNNDIDDFGKGIRKFTKNFSKIEITDAEHTSNILISLRPMIDSFKEFINASNGIPNSGGIFSWFTGDNDVDDFAKKITKVVKSFVSLDTDKVSTASSNLQIISTNMVPSLEKFASLMVNLDSGVGGWDQALPLLNMATTLKEFVRILSGVDLTIVSPALKSLEDINNSFKGVGAKSIESALKSFENNKLPFQNGIAKLLDDTAKVVSSKETTISNSFITIFQKALEKSQIYIREFKTLGINVVRGLTDGIKSEQNSAIQAASNMSKGVIRQTREEFMIHSPSKIFEGIGEWLPISLGNGIKNSSRIATLAGITMAEGIETAVSNTLQIHSESPLFFGKGEWIGKSISSGMESIKGSLLRTAENLGLDTGNFTIKGITDGLAGGEGAITSGINNLLDLLTGEKTVSVLADELGLNVGGAFTDSFTDSIDTKGISKTYSGIAKDAFQLFKESIDKRKEYNVMSYDEEIALWEAFAQKYKEGTEIRLKADKEIGRLKYENSKSWIDREKYYKRLSLEEELAAWERVQGRYEQGHAYRLHAEREIFRLKQEIWQAEYQHAVDMIDEEKYYGRLNLSQELKEWQKIIDITEEASDERKKVNREIFRLEKEISEANLEYEQKLIDLEEERNEKRKQLEEDYYNKTKEIKDKLARDIKDLNDEYENAVKSRTKSLYDSWGIFDKVDPFAPIDGSELVGNLEDQVVAFDQWQAQIGNLTKRGIDQGLIEELRDMGPKALPQILALNKLTDTELNKYVILWKKKNVEAKDQAVYELQGLRRETEEKIQELTWTAQNELQNYRNVWEESLKELDRDNEKQLKEIEKDWIGNIGGMTTGGIKLIQGFRKDWFGELEGMISDTRTQLNTLQQLTSGVSSFDSIAQAATSAISTIDPKTLGKNVAVGLAGGVLGSVGLVGAAGTVMGKTLIGSVAKTLDSRSPSREMEKFGQYSNEGLAQGLKKFSSLVASEGAMVGRTALEAVSLSIQEIPDLLGNDTDEFSITPVLDLSNIKSGIYDINSLLNSTNGLSLGSTMELLPLLGQTNQNGILTDIRSALLAISNPEVDLSGVLTIQVTNDKGEIIEIATTAIKDILRRESR